MPTKAKKKPKKKTKKKKKQPSNRIGSYKTLDCPSFLFLWLKE